MAAIYLSEHHKIKSLANQDASMYVAQTKAAPALNQTVWSSAGMKPAPRKYPTANWKAFNEALTSESVKPALSGH
jgi:hypothetical protein